MELKKASGDEDELTNQEPQNPIMLSGVCSCGGTPNLMQMNLVQELVTRLRPIIGEQVEEAMKRVVSTLLISLPISSLPSSLRSTPQQVEPSAERRLRLHFVGTLPRALFTMSDIQHQGASLKVELCDDSWSRVEDGPVSSVKIMIVVLDGDFEVEDGDDWTEEGFHNNVVQQRKGKRPLLVGECEICLSKGVADVRNIMFTDNSKCTRSENFRLGAQVIKGLPPDIVVKSAVSKAFRVKEQRSQSYQKREFPILQDDVWRLKNIAKNGPICQRLAAEKVYTVKDFLRLYNADAKKLQNILNVSEKKWLEIVKNAESCTLSKEYYKFQDDTARVSLLLDCVFNVISVTFEGQSSQPYGMLDDSQKELADKLRIFAYEKQCELQKIYAPINQTSACIELLPSSSARDSYMQCLDANMNENGSELQNNYYVSTNEISLQAESTCPTNIMATNMQCLDASAYDVAYQVQNTHVPANQMSPQVESACPSTFIYTNVQCLDAAAANQGMQADTDSSSLTTYFCEDYQHGALTGQMQDPDTDDELLRELLRTIEEGGSIFEASSNENVIIKLKAACYVTKAALRFMISVQQDHSAPRKKQKLR